MVVYQVVLSPQANVGTTNRVYRRKCVMLTICLMVSKERKPSFMRLGLPSCTTYAGTTQGRVILHIYCVQNKPNTWLALGRRRPIIFFFRSSSFVVVKALSLTSMFRLESSVSKKSCLRCTRTWCFGGQQKKTTNNNNFFFFFRPSSFYFKYFMLSLRTTLIDYLVVFNASKRVFCCL